MTKKDFDFIMEIISGFSNGMRVVVGNAFANRLGEVNPRFKKERFLEGCNIDSPFWWDSERGKSRKIR